MRFSLANERTFLAWTRTALALIAGGIAVEVLALDLEPNLRLAAAMLLVGAGIVTPVAAWFGWVATERALRMLEPLPQSVLGLVMSAMVAVVGILVLVAVLLG